MTNWTKQKPKDDGYYWLKEKGEQPRIAQVCFEDQFRGQSSLERRVGNVYFFGTDNYSLLEQMEGEEWCGPIKVPEFIELIYPNGRSCGYEKK